MSVVIGLQSSIWNLFKISTALTLPKEYLSWFMQNLKNQEVMYHVDVLHFELSYHIYYAPCNELLYTY